MPNGWRRWSLICFTYTLTCPVGPGQSVAQRCSTGTGYTVQLVNACLRVFAPLEYGNATQVSVKNFAKIDIARIKADGNSMKGSECG